MNNRVHILLFHRVNTIRDEMWDPMDPALFEAIIKHVIKKYHVLSDEEYFSSPGKNYSKIPSIITFDDGYRDFIDYALPILKKYSCPSSMFVTTECIEKGVPTWTYLLDHYFFYTNKLELMIPSLGSSIDILIPERKIFKNKVQLLEFAKTYKQSLKHVPFKQREEITTMLLNQMHDVVAPENLMMNWKEIKQIISEGVCIGSHTVSHPPLAQISDQEELWKEISLSGKILKEKTGTFPLGISYPVGSYNKNVMKLSEKAGYKWGYAVNNQIYDTQKHSMFEIPRLELYNESEWRTMLRVNGTISKIKTIFKR